MEIQLLIGPIVGGVIGGITNGIAIKMLFRPYYPIKIGKWTIPFTPGVIPREKSRIAAQIGKVVSEELLNPVVVKELLLREELIDQIKEDFHRYLQENKENKQTIEEQLIRVMGEDKTTFLICEAEEQLTSKIYDKVLNMEMGILIVNKLKEAIKEGGSSSLLGPLSFLINDSLIESMAHKIEPFITEFIENEGEDVIRKAVEEESHHLMQMPLSTCIEKAISHEEVIVKVVENSYKNLIENHLKAMLNKIDIAYIVETRILAYDMMEMEKIILSMIKKELQAIIWFGVLLGAILGLIVNIL